ncbi:ribosome biogenesis GTPase Der [Haliangium ochraceum]|uniref:GTPase Der n=1 Tax=Haliangium ochraceum (strain DSM 14365 / JCM 11303 / SMP-2) TaxID=502025 RepID=D0LY77_HALO1|nr:ribosome biogenesis GTPase Der [Haliangium ochraceum]ACY16227.1 ribosome-associated GTPase EngA [Haliangium ochraceum DSM 14365]
MTKPLIAIVGRPNVGKSTLYNRLVGGRPALVHDTPGLTRDRRYGAFSYMGHRLRLVDTGGLDPEAAKEVIGAGIHRQADAALQEANAVLFVLDATAGITPLDHEVASKLRKLDKPLLVCANKVDHAKREVLTAELFALGLGDVYPVSATHGRGVDDMLEALVATLGLPPVAPVEDEPEDDEGEEGQGRRRRRRRSAATAEAERAEQAARGEGEGTGEEDIDRPSEEEVARARRPVPGVDVPLRVAMLGKPNAGKSSLVNRLVGSERSLVHHQPGTTMDPVDTPFEFAGRSYVLVDTAGIRRRARVEAETEKIAVSMAISQIERADIVVLVIDGKLGPSEQDARLAGLVEDSGRGLVVAVNKVDLLSGVGAGSKVKSALSDTLHFLSYAPMVLVSALRGDGVADLLSTVDRVALEHAKRVPTAELNRFFAEVCETHPPPLYQRREVRIHYLTQGGVRPPTFLLWANRPDGVAPAYRRYLVNQLRARYGFEGSPVRLVVKAKQRVVLKRRNRGRRPRKKR